MPEPKPYTHVRLIEQKAPIARYEIRVSIFVEYDEHSGRRSVTGKPSRKEAVEIAKEIALSERVRTGAPVWK